MAEEEDEEVRRYRRNQCLQYTNESRKVKRNIKIIIIYTHQHSNTHAKRQHVTKRMHNEYVSTREHGDGSGVCG